MIVRSSTLKKARKTYDQICSSHSLNLSLVEYAKRLNMDENKQKLPWIEIHKQAKSALDVWKKRNNQSTPSTLVDEYVTDYAFLNEKLEKELCKVLEHWHINHSLDKTEKDTFQMHSEYLLKFAKNSSEAKNWFSQHVRLVDLAKTCVDDIASYGYGLEIKGPEDSSLQSFDTLIQAFSNSDCDQLLEVIVRCISNSSYTEALRDLSKSNASTLNLTQHFLLVTCPDYTLTCDKDKSHLQKLLKNMRHDYVELLTHFLSNIGKWTDTVVLCLLYLIRFILSDSGSLSLEEKCDIQEAMVTSLLKQPFSSSNNEEARITVIHAVLDVLLEITRSDNELLGKLKKHTTNDNDKLLKILKQISDDNSNERAQLHAFELLSSLMPEEEFVRANDSAMVTELFVKNFNEALEDNKDRAVEGLIRGLKGL